MATASLNADETIPHGTIPQDVEADDVAQLYIDHPPLQRLIDVAINQTLEAVADQLGVKQYDAGDGSEDFWGDVGGSVINIAREAGIEEMSPAALKDVGAERFNQDKQWGGPRHDDSHAAIEWLDYISHQIDRAGGNSGIVGASGLPAATVRGRLVKIAALALAGIQSIDRKSAACDPAAAQR